MGEAKIHRSRVLIVEDQGIVAEDIKNGLEDSGYEVTGVAASGCEAIREATENCPDLVLMDIRLQGTMDGIQAAQILHRQFGLPIIYLTAHVDKETLERAKQTEPVAFLVKPFRQA